VIHTQYRVRCPEDNRWVYSYTDPKGRCPLTGEPAQVDKEWQKSFLAHATRLLSYIPFPSAPRVDIYYPDLVHLSGLNQELTHALVVHLVNEELVRFEEDGSLMRKGS